MKFLYLFVICSSLVLAEIRSEDVISTVAGDGTAFGVLGLFLPTNLAVDQQGNVYVINFFGSIYKIETGTGIVTQIAGDNTGTTGDGGPAAMAKFTQLGGIATDNSGNIFVVDGARLRKIDILAGTISTIAGSLKSGFSGDGALASSAMLSTSGLSGIAIDSIGNIIFADTGNMRIRKIDIVTGIISTVAGNGQVGTPVDGSLATNSPMTFILSIAVDSNGNIYFPMQGTIWEIEGTTGIISAVADSGGFSGIAIDHEDKILVLDTNQNKVLRIDRVARTITTVAGGGTISEDGCAATSAIIYFPAGLAIDPNDNIFIADEFGLKVRRVGSGSVTNFDDTDLDGFSDIIENAAGSNPNDPNSTPFQGSVELKTSYIDHGTLFATIDTTSANNTNVIINGSLPISAPPLFEAQQVTCTLGRTITRVFTLDKHGNMKGISDTLTFRYFKGKPGKSGIRFKINLANCDFTQLLASAKMHPPSFHTSVANIILFNNVIYAQNIDIGFATRATAGGLLKAKGSGDFGNISGRTAK